ncbi:aldehyde dehydrogenase EutE [Myxococcota bacterium]|nr:aldehyde dehydrogenase EutE [Myxococcota bacterium]MBU1431123.1 aldehyde dehydrogenase EutE [Myxococcota bacterium]
MVDDTRISRIVEQVVARLAADGVVGPSAPAILRAPRGEAIGGRGVYPTIDAAVAAAKRAFHALRDISLEDRARFIQAMRDVSRAERETLSRMAVEETGLGRYEDKLDKNLLALEKTPGVEALRPLASSGDHGLTLTEWAPFGVIGSITPCTNPSETIINNGIGMLAAGNAVVFNVHPNAKKVSAYFIDRLNHAIMSVGGPPDLFTCVAEPTLKTAAELMHHPQVRLLVVTGGGAVVKAAMTSGKRAIAAGPGNPPVVVDETADIAKAARDIVKGASMDNNIICLVEKEIIAVADIADMLKRALSSSDAVELKAGDVRRLTQLIITPDNHVNKDFVGKDAALIARAAGIRVPDSTRLLFAEVEEAHPIVQHELLMPVVGLVRAPDVDAAIDCAVRVEHGFRHTAIMHSTNINALSRMARAVDASIFVKNGPSLAGTGYGGEGFTSWTIASPTGEGMTYAPHFARARRCVLKDAFRIV